MLDLVDLVMNDFVYLHLVRYFFPPDVSGNASVSKVERSCSSANETDAAAADCSDFLSF